VTTDDRVLYPDGESADAVEALHTLLGGWADLHDLIDLAEARMKDDADWRNLFLSTKLLGDDGPANSDHPAFVWLVDQLGWELTNARRTAAEWAKLLRNPHPDWTMRVPKRSVP
jgi:hypothetical protein